MTAELGQWPGARVVAAARTVAETLTICQSMPVDLLLIEQTPDVPDALDPLRDLAAKVIVLPNEHAPGIPEEDAVGRLSAREKEVLRLAGHGLTDTAIARDLGVSTHTVRTYFRRIFSKLNAVNRADAVTRAGLPPVRGLP